MQKTKSIWGKYEEKTDKVIIFQGGFTDIWLKRMADGWRIKEDHQESVNKEFYVDVLDDTDEKTDAHIFQTGRSDVLYIQPALPSKPVVFRNNKTLAISPRQSMLIFLAIPVNIQFYHSQIDAENLITEFATQRLSDTWFGEPDNGEPAFSVGSRFSSQTEQLHATYFEAICPIRIHNNSHQMLELQRLIIHVEYLNLYQKSGQLMTDVVTIEFKGQDLISNLQISTEKSLHGEAPKPISKARLASSKNILSKSFHFIKNFTQL